MADDEKQALQSWWLGLSAEQQAEVSRLVQDDPVPDWVVTELRDSGMPQVADWWPQEVDGQTVAPVELVQFVANQDPDAARPT
jgi:hypothetical protein